MKIDEALRTRKQELESIQRDIDSLENQARGLKDHVKKYRRLKKSAKDLKQTRDAKQTEYDNIIGFFQQVDDNYLNKIYPLFANLPENNQQAANA